jgi:hypothetical protein
MNLMDEVEPKTNNRILDQHVRSKTCIGTQKVSVEHYLWHCAPSDGRPTDSPPIGANGPRIHRIRRLKLLSPHAFSPLIPRELLENPYERVQNSPLYI